ncbi:TPA: hypothetical protein R8E60_001734, partial [Campylobacter coli]|nr:hypothetical protein [Campylobacter coli]
IKTIRGNANEYLMQLNDLERELKKQNKTYKVINSKNIPKIVVIMGEST